MKHEELQATLLRAAFPRGVPDLVTTLLPHDWDPRNFDAGPIFASSGHHRFYIADSTDSEVWTSAVLARAPQAESFLRLSAPGGRRMVDTDGYGLAIYLDDLPGDGVMCERLDAQTGARAQYISLCSPPESCAQLEGEGRLFVREGDGDGLLWVTEARYTGRSELTQALAAALWTLPAAFLTLQAKIPAMYIDGIEIYPEGALDLTPGFV